MLHTIIISIVIVSFAILMGTLLVVLESAHKQSSKKIRVDLSAYARRRLDGADDIVVHF